MLHTLSDDACSGDGLCVEVCPKDVLELVGGKARTVESAAEHCLGCGQCVAVCPKEALMLDGLSPDALARPTGEPATFAQLTALLQTRRSVRTFKDAPVERELIDQVLEAAASAPPPFPPHGTEVVVLDTPADLERLWRACVAGYDKLLGAWRNPIGRTIIRWRRGPGLFAALRDHVIPIVQWDNERARTRGVDRYTYHAPALLLFHANGLEAAHEEAALVVATYAMIAAHSLGLGATMLSIVPPVLNNIDHDLRRDLGIPDGNRAIVALILGHPKAKYRRTLRRPLKSVRYLRPDSPGRAAG